MDGESPEPDVVEQDGGPRLPLPRVPVPGWLPRPRQQPRPGGWRPSRGAAVLAVATLAAGLIIGYAVGHGQRQAVALPGAGSAPGTVIASAEPSPAAQDPGRIQAQGPPSTFTFAGPALTENPGTCSAQIGRVLELGIPVTNQSPETVLLDSAAPAAPVAGLIKVLAWRWGPCGYDADGIRTDTAALGPGETAWLTAVVRPLTRCPSAAPLEFHVTYSVNGRRDTIRLPGFADLHAASYSGCRNSGG